MLIKKQLFKHHIRLFLTGFGMGSADIVPGVSGGTIAFIFGIYEELIFSIKKLSGETLKLVLRGKIHQAIKSIPFNFLVPLGTGILSALLLLASLIKHLLASSPEIVWSFFFGLIVASILIVRKRVVSWDKHDIVAFLVSSIGAYVLVGFVPVATPETYLAFFLSGAIAIVAMILPGVSGSFLLVLLGKYEQILHAVVEKDIIVLLVFMAGAALGISLFSRVLTWLFAKHHDIAIAVLSGFMLGSLRKVWPWKETVGVVEHNILPALDYRLVFSLGLMAISIFLMLKLDKIQATREQMEDIEDKDFKKTHEAAVKSQKPGVV